MDKTMLQGNTYISGSGFDVILKQHCTEKERQRNCTGQHTQQYFWHYGGVKKCTLYQGYLFPILWKCIIQHN